MRALRLEGIGKLVEVELSVPEPQPDEVLVQTAATTICSSDLNDIAHNPFSIRLPQVLGHEGAGWVAAMGEAAAGQFAVGERVAAHPVIPCLTCEACRRGLGHLCSNLGHLGLDRGGTFAEYFCIRSDRLRRVPPETEMACGALLEPVSVCLEALERGRVGVGDSVLIVGDGPFGILIARLALERRPARVILVGRHDFRMQQVPEVTCINARRTADVARAVREANGGVGVDVAVMAVGSQEALDLALTSSRARGRAVVFSAVKNQVTVDLFRLHTQALEIVGACNDHNLIDAALGELGNPNLRLGSLVTHRLSFEQWRRAFELARNGKDEALKVALVFANGT